MAIEVLNCLTQSRINTIISNCCCEIACDLTNTYNSTARIVDLTISSEAFGISNILIDGNPITYPIDIGEGQSVPLSFTICAPDAQVIDNLVVYIDALGLEITTRIFELMSQLPSLLIQPSQLNFGNVAIGSGASLYINVPDEFFCCNNFFTSTLTAPFSDIGGVTVCPGDGAQQIGVFFSPSELGTATQDLTITINECNSIIIPISGNGIEPPSGSATPQKNKVDQTTRVEACSPRTSNNRCQTTRTIQNAIKTNARRFGKR